LESQHTHLLVKSLGKCIKQFEREFCSRDGEIHLASTFVKYMYIYRTIKQLRFIKMSTWNQRGLFRYHCLLLERDHIIWIISGESLVFVTSEVGTWSDVMMISFGQYVVYEKGYNNFSSCQITKTYIGERPMSFRAASFISGMMVNTKRSPNMWSSLRPSIRIRNSRMYPFASRFISQGWVLLASAKPKHSSTQS
jgi:hypothetical protein